MALTFLAPEGIGGMFEKLAGGAEYSKKAYAVGDICYYDDAAYVCKTAIAAPGEEDFDEDKWTQVTLGGNYNLIKGIAGADLYESGTQYDKGAYVIKDGELYVCTADPKSKTSWDEDEWTLVSLVTNDTLTKNLKDTIANLVGSGVFDEDKEDYAKGDVVLAPDPESGEAKPYRAKTSPIPKGKTPGEAGSEDYWEPISIESIEEEVKNFTGENWDENDENYNKYSLVIYKGKTYIGLQDDIPKGTEPGKVGSEEYWKEINSATLQKDIDDLKNETVGEVDEFDKTETYKTGDYVEKDGVLYRAKEDIAAGDWDATKWDTIDLQKLATGFANITDYDEIDDWSKTATYLRDDVVDDDGVFYICIKEVATASTTKPAEDTEHWKKIAIGQLAKDKLDNPASERLEGNVLTISEVDANGNIEYKWMPVSEIPTQGTSVEVAGGTLYDKEKFDYKKGDMIVYIDEDTRSSKAYYCLEDYPDDQAEEIVPGTEDAKDYWRYISFASLQGDISAAASGLTPSITGGKAWVTSEAYEFGDVVTYGEGDECKAYVAIKDDATGGHTPGATGSEAYWKEINFKTLNKDKANLVDIAGNGAEDWEAKTGTDKYEVGTPVIKDGKIYICIKEATNQEPATAGGADYWKELNLSDIQVEKADLEKVSGASIEDDEWEAKAYDAGEYVLYEGALYRASEDVTATDIPGTSNKWVVINLKGLNNLHDVILKDADLTKDDKTGTYYVADGATFTERFVNRYYLNINGVEIYFDNAIIFPGNYYASRVISVDSDTPYATKDFVRDNSTCVDVLPNGTDFDTVGAWKDSSGDAYDYPLFLGKWFIPYDTANYAYTNLPDEVKYMDGATEKYYPSYIETSCGNFANYEAQTLTVVTPDGLKIYTRILDAKNGTFTTEWALVGSNDIDIEGEVDTTDKKIVTFTHDELKSTSTNDYMVSFYVNNDELSIKSKSVNGTTGVLTVTFNKELGDDDEVTAHLIKKN